MRCPFAGDSLLYGVGARGRHQMGFAEDRPTNLRRVVAMPLVGSRSDRSIVPARDFASGRLVS